jgi:hypothetical protein
MQVSAHALYEYISSRQLGTMSTLHKELKEYYLQYGSDVCNAVASPTLADGVATSAWPATTASHTACSAAVRRAAQRLMFATRDLLSVCARYDNIWCGYMWLRIKV